jgi:hypothetical protein
MRSAAFLMLLELAACQPTHIQNGPIIIKGRQAVYVEPLDVQWLARQVDSLRLQNPEVDAYEAVLAGDLRFWALSGGMSGELPRVPGVEPSDLQAAIQRFEVRTFRYTGEGSLSFPADDSVLFRWLVVTMSYATRYNRERQKLRPLHHQSPGAVLATPIRANGNIVAGDSARPGTAPAMPAMSFPPSRPLLHHHLPPQPDIP